MRELQERGEFLKLAGLFEGLLVLLAVVLGFWTGVNPLAHWAVRPVDFLWGLLAAAGLFLLLFVLEHLPFSEFQRIMQLLTELLGKPLAECRWYDLLLLAMWVGFSEELLFRGFLQPWMERHLQGWAALLLSNVIFGVLHAITAWYAVLAGLMGVFLGWLLDATGSRRLMIPVVTHAVYDFAAFLWVAHRFRREEAAPPSSPPEEPFSPVGNSA